MEMFLFVKEKYVAIIYLNYMTFSPRYKYEVLFKLK